MTHEDFKDLPRRTTSDKVLRDRTFSFAESSIDINVELHTLFLKAIFGMVI